MTEAFPAKLRVDFLDGVRGWAALMVVFFHLMIRVLGNTTPLYKTRYFAFITDGHFAVFTFFVLSGFALSITFIKRPQQVSIPLAAITRYLRLLIPIVLTSFMAYGLMKAGLIFNLQIMELANAKAWLGEIYNFEASFPRLLKFCFFDAFFHHKVPTSYNIVLWTMSTEYAGSLLIYLSVGLFRKENNRLHLLPLAATALYLLKNNPSLACFILGYFLAEAYFSYGQRIKALKATHFISLFLFFIPITVSTYFKIHDDRITALLAFVLVFSVTFSSLLQSFFSNSVSKFLGKISFPLYLVHMLVVCSWSSYLFLTLPQYGYPHQVIANSIVFSSVVLSLFLAWLISPVENFSVKYSKQWSVKIVDLLLDKVEVFTPLLNKMKKI